MLRHYGTFNNVGLFIISTDIKFLTELSRRDNIGVEF